MSAEADIEEQFASAASRPEHARSFSPTLKSLLATSSAHAHDSVDIRQSRTSSSSQPWQRWWHWPWFLGHSDQGCRGCLPRTPASPSFIISVRAQGLEDLYV
jgi:hypothetical protein